MKNFLFILFSIYILFLFLVIKYNNPHKLYYLFGKKGSGKSTIMVHHMIRYLRKGWDVWTDMPDVNIFGVHVINAKDLETFTPSKHSALFLDELGLTFDARKFKSFPDGVNEWFKFQRKYKVVCYVNSQSFDVDKKIRDLIDKFYLCQSIGGVISICRPIRRNVTITQATGESESRLADQLEFEKIWKWRIFYLPHYFKFFDSFSAPPREIIPYKFIDDGINVCRGRSLRKLLKELDN